MPEKNESIKTFFEAHIKEFFAIHDGQTPDSGLHDLIMSEVEKVLIAETLKYTSGVQAKAAQILGISRNTLRKKMQELGV